MGDNEENSGLIEIEGNGEIWSTLDTVGSPRLHKSTFYISEHELMSYYEPVF